MELMNNKTGIFILTDDRCFCQDEEDLDAVVAFIL